jgi:hypothetical protein
MSKRKLRIVITGGRAYLGVCERCSLQFRSTLPDQVKAEAEMFAAFDFHKCLPLDSSQNALRVVREATEGK